MCQDIPFANLSVRQRILLISVVLTVGNLALTVTRVLKSILRSKPDV